MSIEAAVATPMAGVPSSAPPPVSTPPPQPSQSPPVTMDTPIEFAGPDGQPVVKTFRELTEAVNRPALTPDQVKEYERYKKAWAGDPATIAELAGSMVPKDTAPAPGSPEEKFLSLTKEISDLKSQVKEQMSFKETITQQAETSKIRQVLQIPDIAKNFPVLSKLPQAAEEIRGRLETLRASVPNGRDPNLQNQLTQQAILDVNKYWSEAAAALGVNLNQVPQAQPAQGPQITMVNDRAQESKLEPSKWVYDPRLGQMVDRQSQQTSSLPPNGTILPPVNGGAVPPVPQGPATNTRMTPQDLAAAMKARRAGMIGGNN